MNTLTFRAFFEDYANRVSIIIGRQDITGEVTQLVAPVQMTMEPRIEGMMITNPSMQFSPAEAENLMTALWDAGIRPRNHISPDGEIRRLNDHLQDMRKLVFKEIS
jgi:hypothetical protein